MLDRLNEIHDAWIYQGDNTVKKAFERVSGSAIRRCLSFVM